MIIQVKQEKSGYLGADNSRAIPDESRTCTTGTTGTAPMEMSIPSGEQIIEIKFTIRLARFLATCTVLDRYLRQNLVNTAAVVVYDGSIVCGSQSETETAHYATHHEITTIEQEAPKTSCQIQSISTLVPTELDNNDDSAEISFIPDADIETNDTNNSTVDGTNLLSENNAKDDGIKLHSAQIHQANEATDSGDVIDQTFLALQKRKAVLTAALKDQQDNAEAAAHATRDILRLHQVFSPYDSI